MLPYRYMIERGLEGWWENTRRPICQIDDQKGQHYQRPSQKSMDQSSIVANIGPTMAVFKIYDTKEDNSLKLHMTLSNWEISRNRYINCGSKWIFCSSNIVLNVKVTFPMKLNYLIQKSNWDNIIYVYNINANVLFYIIAFILPYVLAWHNVWKKEKYTYMLFT